MIKIHKKDSIIDILIKINHSTSDEIILEFPFGHPVLHNFTSLKIIKNHTKQKELIIITSDRTAQKLGDKLGIKYSLTKNTDIVKYNYTFGEYGIYVFKKYIDEFINNLLSKTNIEVHSNKYTKSRIGYFLAGLGLSIFLFFFVFYFAVNKTTIYITPEITIKNKAANFYFQEAGQEEILADNENIKLKKITKLVHLKNTFRTSGIDDSNVKRSHGEVIMSNLFLEPIDLIEKTRLSTSSGVIYTANSSIHLPAATKNSSGALVPGTTKVRITAKTHDQDGTIIGARGNIDANVKLFLPGLKEDQDKIYAHSLNQFKGGDDDITHILSEKDIGNAKIILEGMLRNYAIDEVKKQIESENKTNNVTYEILGIDDIIKYSQLDIKGDEELKIDSALESFELSGTLKITTYIYNKQLVLSKMRSTIKDSILEEVEELRFLNEDSLKIAGDPLFTQEKPFIIKATAQIEAFYAHNFLSQQNIYVEKLKNNIAGINKQQASKILLNNSNISDVNIETRPFFIKKVSTLPQNIEFKVVEK